MTANILLPLTEAGLRDHVNAILLGIDYVFSSLRNWTRKTRAINSLLTG